LSSPFPYEGDAEFFGVTPKQFPINPPNAMVLAGEILVAVDLWDGQDEVVLQNELRQIIDRIKSYLDYLREEMAIFYRELPERISQLISTQRKKFLRNQNILASLNIPIRQRVDVPQVIPVSVSKRVLKRVLPPTPKEAFSPEPALPDESYEVILQTLQNMAVTMERSPSVFLRIKEEEVRDILLVSLNGIFEGGATGETFSSKGKTDIHILWEGKSILIAELKFWKGQRSLTNALSQLLGYLTWRHTKTALIILNREGEFNHILEQIRLTAEAHSCFKRFLRIEDKTVFRFVFRNPTDSNQEISMTILAFDLPRAAASTKP
jgi:hypothetical protein